MELIGTDGRSTASFIKQQRQPETPFFFLSKPFPLMKPFIPLLLCALAFSSAYAQPGSIDLSFTSGFTTQPSVAVEEIAIQPDGKIIAVGAFYTYDGDSSKGVVRINTDGTRDASFSVGSGLLDSYPEISGYSGRGTAVAVQSDGKILVGGSFSTYNGTLAGGIVRLNPDGSIDQGFNMGNGFNGNVYDIRVQANGKIMCAGGFSYYNGAIRENVARLLPDGSVDPDFVAPAINVVAFKMALQNDGKVLIGGTFNTVGGIPVGRLARLNSDGSLDEDFSQGVGFDRLVTAIHVMADGRIMVGGGFNAYNGSPLERIVRLLPGGSIDASFQADIGYGSDQVRAIVEQGDGKYILLGGFEEANGVPFHNVVRLMPGGATDFSFDPGTSFYNTVLDALLQPDGQLVAAGFFTGYDMSVSSGVVRINTSGSTAIAEVQSMAFDLFPNPTDGMVTIRGEFEGAAEVRVLDCAGRSVHEERVSAAAEGSHSIDLSHLPSGVYTLRIQCGLDIATVRVVRH